ncbi:reverse transcriptase domain-containing protein [Okeania sp. SIO2F5]|nr:hypothetical protein [Okeania sp. SIO2G5]NEP96117.1 hypothetical protein [Okeania sp. SIO2F5]
MEFAEELPLRHPNGKIMCKKDKRYRLSLIRYADDFVILHEDIKVVKQAKAVTQKWLNQIGLELKPQKTRIAHTLEEYEGNKPGFDFLVGLTQFLEL